MEILKLKLKINKYGFYSILILLMSIIIFLILMFFSSNNIDNIRQLLSTIIQSLASILAILISLTLVAVQLSAQNYSKRILKQFISFENKVYWVTITVYLLTIVYGIFLLLNISGNGQISYFDSIKVNMSILLTIWALILLPIYIKYTVVTLGPEVTINKLVEELDENYLKKLISDNYNLTDDPFIPINDIIIHSIKIGDSESIKRGFDGINSQICSLIEMNQINDPEFANYLINYLDQLKNVALLNSDNKTLGLIIDSLMSIVKPILDINSEKRFFILFDSIATEIIKTESIDEALKLIMYLKKFPTDNYFLPKNYGAMWVLERMWITSIEKLESQKYLNKIWIESSMEEPSYLNYQIRSNLAEMRKKIAIDIKEYEIIEEIKFLLNFGTNLSKHDPSQLFFVIFALSSLDSNFKIGIINSKSSAKNENQIQNMIIHAIKFIGLTAIDENIHEYSVSLVFDIDSIMPGTMIREDKVIITEIISSLKKIELTNIGEDELNETKIENIIESLELIGIELAVNNSDYITQTLDALGNIIIKNPELDIALKKSILQAYLSIFFKLLENNPEHINHLLQNCDKLIKFSIKFKDCPLIKELNNILYFIKDELTKSKNSDGNLNFLMDIMNNISDSLEKYS